MPEPTIRLAAASDADAVARLLLALETHYGGPAAASPEAAMRTMVERSIASREGTRYALALANGVPSGLLCFAILRPGYDMRGVIFAKEVFVTREARGSGLGQRLMAWLAEYGRSLGIGRIDLTTDAANAGAMAFYERLGAARLGKVVYRFTLDEDGQ